MEVRGAISTRQAHSSHNAIDVPLVKMMMMMMMTEAEPSATTQPHQHLITLIDIIRQTRDLVWRLLAYVRRRCCNLRITLSLQWAGQSSFSNVHVER